MRVGLAHHLDQFLDHMRRRRQIGIAHAEIDDIGWQAFDAVEIVGHCAKPGLRRPILTPKPRASSPRVCLRAKAASF
jgi:hypothetical protein